LVRAWWDRRAHHFNPGNRYLLGRQIDADALEVAWTSGFQRQRRASAYELALLRPEARLPNWRARASSMRAPATHER
jgi:hypothetical protein